MPECSHTETRGGQWVDNPYYDPADDGYEGDEMVWEPEWQAPATEDIDLHRYRCVKCGAVFRY